MIHANISTYMKEDFFQNIPRDDQFSLPDLIDYIWADLLVSYLWGLSFIASLCDF